MIREFRIEDLERCVQICNDNFKELGYSYDIRKELELSLIEKQYVKPYYFVYEENNFIIAILGFSESGWNHTSYGLCPCYVDKNHHHEGIGKKCTEFRLNKIRELGGKSIFAVVQKQNKWHLERFGFKEINSPQEDDWKIMQLIL